MLGLKLATDPRWVNIVEENIEDCSNAQVEPEPEQTTVGIVLVIEIIDPVSNQWKNIRNNQGSKPFESKAKI